MAAQRPSPDVVPARARLLSVVCTLAAAAMAATCGGQVKVDDDSGDGAGGRGGSAQQSVSNNSSGPGPGPGPGPSSVNASAACSTSNGQGGSGAGGPCFTCAGYIVDCVIDVPVPECDFQPLCPGSDQLFNQLIGCVCMACAMECFNTCNGQGDDGPQCGTCQQGAVSGTCSSPFADCSNDA